MPEPEPNPHVDRNNDREQAVVYDRLRHRQNATMRSAIDATADALTRRHLPPVDQPHLALRSTLQQHGPETYILALARTFPCLRDKLEGITPETWSIDRLIAASGPWSHGERLCLLFIANVWNPGYAREKEWFFDVIEFISIADNRNRAALLNWLATPVWP